MKRKFLLSLLTIAILLSSCTESNVKNTATEYLKKQMKDPSSFKVEKAEVVLDTVPIFLNKRVMSLSEKFSDALDENNRYKDRDSYLWRKEKENASEKLTEAMIEFGLEYQIQKSKEQPYQYMVLISCSGNNSYGGTVSSKYIVIVDKEDTDKVLGEYRIDSDFSKKIIASFLISGEEKLKENEFGKIETEGMTTVEKFIFDE